MYAPTGAQTYTLGASIGSTDTTILLSSFLEPVSNTPYTMALIASDIVYATIAPKTSSSEFISFTGITQNTDGTATLTGVIRGLSRSSPFTASATFKLPHAGQSLFVLSNSPEQVNEYAALRNNNVFVGQNTVPDPVASTDIANKQYVLSVVNGGTVSTNKIVQVGTAGETIATGNSVYLKVADGRWWLTDADILATVDQVQLGIAQGAGTAGTNIAGGVLTEGTDTHNTGTGGALVYISNTAGALSTSAGTNSKVVGQYILSSGGIYFNPFFYGGLTVGQAAALAGSQGTPSGTNKFVTQDNVSSSTADQSQTTQNASSPVGEADLTTKRNKLAQSFIPTKTKISGVNLYKSADTGSFTGTVTVTLQADSAGSPSGVSLATVTLTNAYWLGLSVGVFLAQFGTEYAAITPGNLYWIVITTSTADTSNCINVGTNSAGGYGSGSVKYFDTADGWTTVATIDLYFKTLNGLVSQVVSTGTDGLIPFSMTQRQSAKTFVYIDNKAIDAATSTVVITHNLGLQPTYVRMTAHDLRVNATLFLAYSYGTALIAANGTPTYYTNYYSAQGVASITNGTNSYLMRIEDTTNGFQGAVIAGVTEDTLTLTLSKNSSPSAFGTIYYMVEIFV